MAKKAASGTRGTRKRRGEGESMTGKKAAATEMRKVEPKQLELSASAIESKPGEFRSYFNRAQSHHAIYAKHQGSYRQVIKEAKELNPLLAEAVKLAIKEVDESGAIDFDAIKNRLQVHGFILAEFGSSLQLTLHDTALGDASEHAFKRGFETGVAGKALDAPYPAHSDLGEAHALGWRNGQLKVMKLPHGETLDTAVQRLDSEDEVDLPPAPRPDGEDFADPMSEPMPAEAASAVH